MATTRYIVLQVVKDPPGPGGWKVVEEGLEATNAQQACRRSAERMSDETLGDGVTLVAVPARNWASGRNTFAAKTERKLIRS